MQNICFDREKFMKDILQEIMEWKRREIAPRIREVSLEELAEANARLPKPPSFSWALRRSDGRLAVISEIKRRSPSAGEIAANLSAGEQADKYHKAGADALSVLTDTRYFGGTLKDLEAVNSLFSEKGGNKLPCIRKDFMVHPLQVLEAREAGASAILIIMRVLKDSEVKILFNAAEAAGLDVLFETHDEEDLKRAVNFGAKVIGVNNRDLTRFVTDLRITEELMPRIPGNVTAVSESGVFCRDDAVRVKAAGAHAILVGEALMKARDCAALIQELQV